MRQYQFSERAVSGWPEHWTNGGTGITKFDPERRPLYEAAIKESGRSDIWIVGCELHSSSHDLSDFWEVFRRLEEESRPTPPATTCENVLNRDSNAVEGVTDGN